MSSARIRHIGGGYETPANEQVRASHAPVRGLLGPPDCPMCGGAGERSSAILACTIPCPWCAGRGHVGLERARALRAQLRTKADREREAAAA